MDRNQILLYSLYLTFFIASVSFVYNYYEGNLTLPETANLMILVILVMINVGYTDAVRKQLSVMVEQVRVMSKRTELSLRFEHEIPLSLIEFAELPIVPVRLIIENEGTYIANKCQVILEKVEDEKERKLYWCFPVLLTRSNLPLSEFMDINANSKWYLEFLGIEVKTSILSKKAKPVIVFIIDRFSEEIRKELSQGIYIFTITAYAENVDPVSIKLKMEYTEEDVKLNEIGVLHA